MIIGMVRDLTAQEQRWIRRLKRCFDDMPETLKGFHSPGTITFFDRNDPYMNDEHAAHVRQQNMLESISSPGIARIGEGDW
jgi:hypothetical protein